MTLARLLFCAALTATSAVGSWPFQVAWAAPANGISSATASNSFSFLLGRRPNALRTDSPFGISTAFHPGTSDLDARLNAMQQAGIKWGRQDFAWPRIEPIKGQYQYVKRFHPNLTTNYPLVRMRISPRSTLTRPTRS